MGVPVTFRWKTVDQATAAGEQLALFPDEENGVRRAGTGEFRGFDFIHVNAKRIINTLPDGAPFPFRHTINAYRGCSHACVYCFARPTHEYLGLGMGEEFERVLVVKVNAVERLRAELRSPRWTGEPIAMGTNTDPYQRCEGRYRLTRGIIGVLSGASNPFSVLTKSTLILRDLDLLGEAARRTTVRCNLSIGTLDEAVWRATEPGTPHPLQRMGAVRRLVDAGIETGVLIAPVIPGLSDGEDQLAEVVDACAAAGARSVTAIPMHLRGSIRDHYLNWLRGVDPALAARTAGRYRGANLPSADRERISELVRDRWNRTRPRSSPGPADGRERVEDGDRVVGHADP